MATKRMAVANERFLLDRLAADTAPLQEYRELTQNAIEAILRRRKAGRTENGLITWDIDWMRREDTGVIKLCVTDNGDGMSADDMLTYLNSLAVQGANEAQAMDGNFGVGAKITALHNNPHGVAYESFQEGIGHAVYLHCDDEAGVYGLAPLDDDSSYVVRLNVDPPKELASTKSGTKVILMGHSDEENTFLIPDGAQGGTTMWLSKYLNQRYFRIPDGIVLRVRTLSKDPEGWPEARPASSEKTFTLESVRGAKYLLDHHSEHRGSTPVRGAVVHWWVFENGADASKKLSPRMHRTGSVGVVYQDEVYTQKTGAAGRRALARFSILYGAENVVIYVEPKVKAYADTGRSRLLIDGQDLEASGHLDEWGREFAEKLPPAIQDMIDALLAKADDSNQAKRRDRVLERLERIKSILRPSRYRASASGGFHVDTPVTGGSPRQGQRGSSAGGSSGRHRAGGKSGKGYYANKVDAGVLGEDVHPTSPRPEVKWVSVHNGLRQQDDTLEDYAAEVPADPVAGNLIHLNEDFRAFRDIFDMFEEELGANGDEQLTEIVRDAVKEWIEQQAIEVVVTVRNLENAGSWTRDVIAGALSPPALTAALSSRYFVVQQARRQLNQKKPSAAA